MCGDGGGWQLGGVLASRGGVRGAADAREKAHQVQSSQTGRGHLFPGGAQPGPAVGDSLLPSRHCLETPQNPFTPPEKNLNPKPLMSLQGRGARPELHSPRPTPPRIKKYPEAAPDSSPASLRANLADKARAQQAEGRPGGPGTRHQHLRPPAGLLPSPPQPPWAAQDPGSLPTGECHIQSWVPTVTAHSRGLQTAQNAGSTLEPERVTRTRGTAAGHLPLGPSGP